MLLGTTSPLATALDITFDYRFDDSNFFAARIGAMSYRRQVTFGAIALSTT